MFRNTEVAATPKLTLKDYYDDLKPESDFIKDVSFVLKNAHDYLDRRILDYKYSALSYKLAIVLDIDDTSLSHYPSFKQTNFANDLETQDRRYRAADAPAINPVLDLYKKAIEKSVAVFFITARKPLGNNSTKELHSFTQKNLIGIGYDKFEALYLPHDDELKLPTSLFKSKTRKMIEEQGYKVVLNIGDQPGDLEGGYSEYTYKIPNFLYPDTLPAVFESLVSKKSFNRVMELASTAPELTIPNAPVAPANLPLPPAGYRQNSLFFDKKEDIVVEKKAAPLTALTGLGK